MSPSAPWASQLSALTDELSVALGPWLAEIAGLLAEHDSTLAGHGEPDGFDGLSTRGTPHRLLVSEWLLAMEEPVEFLRRAAGNELFHLAPALRRSAPRARVAVLCDSGPAQWGAARLAQLAILLVMHWRAAAHGVPLTLGVLGDEPGSWRQGDLEPLLKGWQRSRTLVSPGADRVDAWAGTLGAGDEIWLLGGGHGREWANIRQVTIAESGWDSKGVSALAVSLGGRRRFLAMPSQEQAVAAIRGHGFRDAAKARPPKPALLRFPVFPNASRTLLGRGGDERTLVTFSVPDGRPRRHGFPAPVVAAGLKGKRVIALTLAEGVLTPHVVGKSLKELEGARWPYEPQVAADGPLAPLHLGVQGLFTNLTGSWIRLHPKHDVPVGTEVAAVGFGAEHNEPRFALARDHRDAQVIFGQIPHRLSSSDGRVWTAPGGPTLTVPDGDHVVGITLVGSDPALLSQSAGGQILRLVTTGNARVLTQWSNRFVVAAAAHPAHPWLAITYLDGSVIVADLESGERLCRLRGSS
jgi:hypothetical protein